MRGVSLAAYSSESILTSAAKLTLSVKRVRIFSKLFHSPAQSDQQKKNSPYTQKPAPAERLVTNYSTIRVAFDSADGQHMIGTAFHHQRRQQKQNFRHQRTRQKENSIAQHCEFPESGNGSASPKYCRTVTPHNPERTAYRPRGHQTESSPVLPTSSVGFSLVPPDSTTNPAARNPTQSSVYHPSSQMGECHSSRQFRISIRRQITSSITFAGQDAPAVTPTRSV